MSGGDPSVGVDGERKVGAGAVGSDALCLLCLEEGRTGTGEGGLDVNEEVRGGGGTEGGGIGRDGSGGARMVAVVEIKWGEASGSVNGVVVSKFNGGEMGIPIVLEGVDVVTKASEHDLVGVL